MKPIYIFDLDGTLALHHHRLHHILNSKDYLAFEQACTEDTPNQPVMSILHSLCEGVPSAEIWFVTGRSNIVRQQTVTWLWGYTPLTQRYIEAHLFMRPIGDKRKDNVVKEEWLLQQSKAFRSRICAVFEDRQRVVDMWRKNGVTCLQVAEGNF